MNTIQNMLKDLLNESPFDSAGIASIGGALSTADTAGSAENVINDEEDIKLSAKSIRTLFVAHIAEQLVNEEVDGEDNDLGKFGLMLEGKLTVKGKDWIKKFLPTLYAS